MGFKFSKRSLERMEGVHPDLVLVFVTALEDSPIDFGIPGDGGVRTAERQNFLFKDGKSKLDGYKKLSRHQLKKGDVYGHALDFYAYVNHKASWAKRHLAMIAGVILATAKRLFKEGKINIQLRWGGQFGSKSFNGWDMPHFEALQEIIS